MHPLAPSVLVIAAVLSLARTPAAAARSDAELCAEGTGVPREIVMICTRALILPALEPHEVATLLNARGRSLRITGRPQEALRDHEAAMRANAGSAEAYLGRALVRLDLGDGEGADADLNTALELFPYYSQAWSALGRARFLRGDDARAAAALTRAIELNPEDGEVHAFRGLVHYRRARYEEALADLRRARALHLAYPYLPLWEWLAARRAGVAPGDTVERAWRALGPDEWPAPLLAAYLGHGDAAVPARAHARDPRDPRIGEAAFYLGQRDLLAGDATAAGERFRLAAELAPAGSVERAMLPR